MQLKKQLVESLEREGHRNLKQLQKKEKTRRGGEKTSPQKASSCMFKHDPTRCVIWKHINSDLIAQSSVALP